MRSFCSLFVQILNTVPRVRFEQLARKFGSERHARGFRSWEQFVAMMFCHLGRAQSLREIEHGLRSAEGKLNHLGIKAPPRSTLAYANEHRTWRLYEALFYELLDQVRSVARPAARRRFRFKNPLLSIDSTTVELVADCFAWAKYSKCKGAIKLHLMLDHEGMLPVFAVVTDGRSADITVGRSMPFDPGSIIVFDRGYVDYAWFASLTAKGVYFVTRLKKNARFELVEQRPVSAPGIVRDEVVDLIHAYSADHQKNNYVPQRLRRVEIINPEGGQNLVFYSNHMRLAASTIAAIYKDRWQIELFFKALKQNLKIKTFIGTSANALFIQLWTALIAMLLLRLLRLRTQCALSLSNLVAMLRTHLFSHRDLLAWLRNPFEDTSPPEPVQLSLP